jgi:hypothetical protein
LGVDRAIGPGPGRLAEDPVAATFLLAYEPWVDLIGAFR